LYTNVHYPYLPGALPEQTGSGSGREPQTTSHYSLEGATFLYFLAEKNIRLSMGCLVKPKIAIETATKDLSVHFP
jgi:hypothetical protein